MAQSGSVAKQLIRNDYSSTSVTTGAYVELVASLNGETNEIEVFDSSGEDFVLAVGPAGSETDMLQIVPGGNGRVQAVLPGGARLSIKAVSATASVGVLIMNLWG